MIGSAAGARISSENLSASAEALLESACGKNARHLIVLLAIAYVVNFLDRNDIGYAGITMNGALGLTASQFGWAAGISIVSYALLEVPSSLIMQRVGARLWLSRIMITWGIAAGLTALAVGPKSLYALRLLLGAAEAGFFPGVVLLISTWFPAHYRARMLAWFLLAIPASSVIAGPLSGLLLGMNGLLHIAGWQWMFLLQGAPAVALGFVTLRVLADDPREARWLSSAEREVLLTTLAAERKERPRRDLVAAIKDLRVLILTVVQFGFTLGTYGIVIWLPLMLQGHHLSPTRIGLISAPPYIVATVGMLLWARHVDRHPNRIFHLIVTCALAMIGLAASVLSAELLPRLLALTVALLGVSSARMIFWTIPPRFLAGNGAAGGIAFINSVGILGGFFGPLLMGLLRDLTGSFTAGLLTMAAVLLVTTLAAAALRLLAKDGDGTPQ
ncbi:MAG TPA: MFS transporter [Steroidobacteraceae bacterium]|jgi:MFS family permease|nr:MFS transporter [Steroidobacteraceae bacterium]